MKHLIFVLAVALILIAIPFGNTDARLHPDGYKAINKDTGEDHPWGGEGNSGGDPIPISSPANDELSYTTEYSVFGVFVWKFIINIWIIEDHKTEISISNDINAETGILDEETGQAETTTSRN